MNILMVASEMTPFVKTGGLADVAGSLSREMEKRGHNIKAVLPYYRTIKDGNFQVKPLGQGLKIKMPDKVVEGRIMKGRIGANIEVWFIKNDHYYDREGLYGTAKGDYADNAERFIFFCRATLESLKETSFEPDIIHCHDWQTGLIPVYLNTLFKDDPRFAGIRTVFTIHNVAYQGIFPPSEMPLTGLGWDLFTPEGIEFYGKINLMKGGIVYSDILTTVSKNYARQIQTGEYGCGLEGLLKARQKDLYGILNGVDYDEWDPEKDRFIIKNYSRRTPGGKKDCKSSLLKEFRLEPAPEAPLFGLVSRLAEQKGIDLIADTIDEISSLGNLVILGKGDESYENMVAHLIEKHPQKVGVRIGFDEALAHRIVAGSDLFLVPSRYEPCGLNVMHSLKYGTIPIVRATGGPDDIISEFNPDTGKGNGFKFYDYSKEEFCSKLKIAAKLYRGKKLWRKLVQNALSCDFGWKEPAREYEKLYRKAQGRRRGTGAGFPPPQE